MASPPSPSAIHPHPVQALREALAAVGRDLGARGWMPATSGNISARIDADTALITRSGLDKGALTAGDLIEVPLDGPRPRGTSAETPLHLVLYRRRPEMGAVLHTHSLAATVLSRRHQAAGAVILRDFEMQKAIRGVMTHEGEMALPIHANDQDTDALAERIASSGGYESAAAGFLLAGHGLYAWGETIAEAQRHLVALEFMLTCTLEEERLRA